jgi:hypothetical protein
MAMAVATLGPKELKLRAQRQAGGNEVARRYGVPVKKITLAQARKLFPDGKVALREPDEAEVKRRFAEANRKDVADRAAARMHAQVMAVPLNAPQMVKQQQQIEQAANDLHIRAAARAEQGQIRIAELEAELQAAKGVLEVAVAQTAKAQHRIGVLEELNSRVAADAKHAYACINELEAEVSTLKRELAKRGSTGVTTCPVCTARKEANRLFMAAKRKKRRGASR